MLTCAECCTSITVQVTSNRVGAESLVQPPPPGREIQFLHLHFQVNELEELIGCYREWVSGTGGRLALGLSRFCAE